jgi:aldehyde:ferredoxin oxidoreductase
MESFEYEPAWALGANCGNDNAASIAKMIQMANNFGMDAIEIGNVLGTYIEATEQGFVNGDGGLRSGDYLGMIEAIKKVAHRDGVGNVLANGVNAVANHYGHPEIAMSVKGQGVPAYDPRGLKGMGIAYATSNRGACHLRAYTPASELGLIPLQTDPLAWKGKGELTKLLQDIHAFSDSLDLCKFSAFAEGAEEYAAQYSAMVGVPFTMDDVLVAGERIYNLERHYNNLAGFREGSDYLPKRFTEEPSTMPGSEGHVCELDLMLEEYYSARGWENGVVPEAKLQELGVV